ncbi:unnamed protein product [Psylliodes chrysocephalus]|uniref:Uncharacterized protein n=1 Tax=Psylliodes chrysocephalus TaxID=3402493 RepID=A0A9P0CRM5_9CUCU|nr:unnamed protein product [Psylliodes chrysocephala]
MSKQTLRKRRRPLTTHELLSELENIDDDDPNQYDIYVTPPNDTGNITDEDSGEDDSNDPDRLNKNQLHTFAVTNGLGNYLFIMGRNRCLDAIKTGRAVVELMPDTSLLQSIALAETIKEDYSCKGAYYVDPLGQLNDVVVSGTIRVTLGQAKSPADLTKNTIHLRTGVTCDYSRGSCSDYKEEETYWEPLFCK